MFVDPYMDHTVLTEFAVMIPEETKVLLLTDENTVKPSLKPAHVNWIEKYTDQRFIEIRLGKSKSLHDRFIIIDFQEVWIVTQWFKDFTAKAPGSIQKFDGDGANLKIQAYQSLWDSGTPL